MGETREAYHGLSSIKEKLGLMVWLGKIGSHKSLLSRRELLVDTSRHGQRTGGLCSLGGSTRTSRGSHA